MCLKVLKNKTSGQYNKKNEFALDKSMLKV